MNAKPDWLENGAEPTVVEVLSTFQALCLRCLIIQTGSPLKDVLLELEVLRADVADLTCAVCDDDWPVFATAGKLMTLKHAGLP